MYKIVQMKNLIIYPFLLLFTLVACNEKYTPKPRGYFRIDFPEKEYLPLGGAYPYSFEIPKYALIKQDNRNPDQPTWINIVVPANNAEVHISYYNLQKMGKTNTAILPEFMEETRRLAYKHSIKADAINEKIFVNEPNRVFGTIYQIKGNAASPFQFFITDSTTHFLRGALYINEVPNIDSLKPVIDFLEPDIIHLIETASWK